MGADYLKCVFVVCHRFLFLNLQDFDDLIPGHGGITDRFDCQLGMASFAHVYFTSFIKIPDVSSIMFSILALDVASQRLVLQKLMDAVTARELP